MRHNISASLIRLLILAIALWCSVLTVSAQTTAFSYQGQLSDGGSPANGSYDIQFKLFDSLTAGAQIGPTIPLTNVAVSSGIFTVTLDFGASSFPGANRWLEISMRLTGGGTFTTLTPRQQMTSTPYAIKSLSTATADGLSAACGGCVSSSQIGSLPTGSANYIQNTTTQQASSNFNISGNGLIGGNVGIGISSSPESKLQVLATTTDGVSATTSAVGRSGIAGIFTGAATRGFGTYGSSVANQGSGVWGDGSRIGVYGSAGTFPAADITNAVPLSLKAGVAGFSNIDAGANGITAGVYGASSAPDGVGVFGGSSSGLAGRFDGNVVVNGNVGIGTTMPKAKLDTAGTIRSTAQTVPTSGAGLEVIYSDNAGYLTSYDRTGNAYKPLNLNGSDLFLNTVSGGNVGIGMFTPNLSPSSKLTVIASVSGEFSPPAIYGENTFGNGVRGYGRTGIYGASDLLNGTGVTGSNQNGVGVLGTSAGTNTNISTGVRGTSINGTGVSGAGAVAGVYGESSASSGVGVFGKSTSGLAGRFDGNVVVNGNVGINTNPAEKLHVAGAFLRVDGAGDERAYLGGDGAGNDVQLGSSNPNILDVRIYNSALTQHMNLFVGTLTITGGADLAEPFDVGSADTLKPGLVVAIDPAQPGHLRITDKAYDRTVAGIISGAGGVKPGMMMSQSNTIADGTQPVALSGRVYCWADASNGAIKPGDMLTTSATPGHAMKVTNHAKAQGAIIGKAMTTLKEGKGLVLVLVTLQ